MNVYLNCPHAKMQGHTRSYDDVISSDDVIALLKKVNYSL